MGLGFNFPPANNTKKGALISAQANLDKSILSMESVSRSIAADILVSVDTLKELDEQITDVRTLGRLLHEVSQRPAGNDFVSEPPPCSTPFRPRSD